MQHTKEQHDAIHIHDRNLIVVAGAGSGKTRVLVERYIELLEQNPDWPLQALVAITFTREAAYEMRHRVREELERRAQASEDDRWARRLTELDRARIDTIHGLCADILRANAAVAGIDPQFEVLDAVDAAIMLSEVVADARATVEQPAAQLFAHYDAWQIIDTLNRFELVNYEGAPLSEDPEALVRRWQDEWSALALDGRDRLLACQGAIDLTDTEDPPVSDSLATLFVQYFGYLKRLQAAADAAQIYRLLRDCHQTGAVGNKGSITYWGSKEKKQEAAKALRDLRALIKALIDDIGEPPGEIDGETARVLPLWQQLLAQVRAEYRRRKRERARLDFDDLERLTVELLAESSVRDRYRNAEFKQLLVDEFQDTNEAQRTIIEALADKERGGSLFLVGDPKQSIYQFRGADVSVFNRARDEIEHIPAGLELGLSTSFRSHRALIAQFNALFRDLLTRDEASPVANFQVAFDQDMKAFRQDSPKSPAIELLLLDRDEPAESGENVKGKRGRKQRIPADDLRRREAEEIAGRMQTLLTEKRPVFDKDKGKWRPIRFGDMVLLFQSLTRVTLYEEAFKARGIPYLTIAGRGYYDRQEVWDMLDLLRFLHNPADDLSLATVLRAPFFAFSDDLLFALRLIPATGESEERPSSLWQALSVAADGDALGIEEEDRPLLQFALATLGDLRDMAGRVTISELLRRALDETNYLAILSGLHDGDRRRGNIEKLLTLAQDSGKITLGKFSQYLADLSARELREGEALLEAGNAVRLMTVHASKGLEFPLVMLADASWKRGNADAPILLADPNHGLSCRVYSPAANRLESGFAHRRNLELAALREEAERVRLLYVAATRAQDYLLISGQVSQGKQGWSAGGWLGLLLEALELRDLEREAQQTCHYAGEKIAITMPSAPPPAGSTQGSARDSVDRWADEASGAEFDSRLIQPLPSAGSDAPRHITATQINLLGNWRYGAEGNRRIAAGELFRAEALHNIPIDADAGPLERAGVSPLTIGKIVHELLAYRKIATGSPADVDLIRSVAWGQGVTSESALETVLRQTRDMLRQYSQSEAHQWISAARAAGRPVYEELPFSYRTEERVIHGVMDVLLEDAPGDWVIIDYKTGAVSDADYSRHARRFRLQLGIYAAAVKAQFGLARFPRVCIHYLRGNMTVPLSTDDCLAELDRLEETLGELATTDG